MRSIEVMQTMAALALGAGVLVNACFAAAGGATSETNEGTLVVLNKSGASASLIDLTTNEEVAQIPVGVGPHEVAVSSDGKTAVVCNYGGPTPGSTLTVIDLPSRAAVKTINLGRYQRPHGIVFMPDDRRIVVTAEAQQKLLIVDIDAGVVEHAIDTDQQVSHMVAVTPDMKRAFVSNIGSGSVSVIDLESNALVEIVETGPGAEAIDVSPDGREVWVANRAVDTVTILDANSLETLGTFECGEFPIRLKFTPDGKSVLISNARSGDLALIDAKSRDILKRISMDATAKESAEGRVFEGQFGQSPVPIGILVEPGGSRAFVANTNADIVTIIDLAKREIAGRLEAGREPDGLGYSPLNLQDSAGSDG
ncbi:MAG: cytochrome D1 domain-containing protein [Phycisphaerales bacterium]